MNVHREGSNTSGGQLRNDGIHKGQERRQRSGPGVPHGKRGKRCLRSKTKARVKKERKAA
jgi:hypothetical protein